MADACPVLQSLEALCQTNQETTLNYVVAFSGGVDSMVLLHALNRLGHRHNELTIRAVHVNHQLQSASETWADFCEALCRKLEIDFSSIIVDVETTSGKGLEASARSARYDALQANVLPSETLLTAHHLDDQVETVMLRLLRGSGIEGAAGILTSTYINQMRVRRPFLAVTRQQILDYARQHQLTWIEDPSNQAQHLDRNYLRHTLVPLLEQRWPGYRATIGRFAEHEAMNRELLEVVAAQDYQECQTENENRLSLNGAKHLSRARLLNLLRYWLRRNKAGAPSDAQMQQVLQVIFSRVDAEGCVASGEVEIHRFRQHLYVIPKKQLTLWPDARFTLDSSLDLQHLNNQVFSIESVHGHGLRPEFRGMTFDVQFRQGGEICKLPGRAGHRKLKKLLQELGIPPWERERLPLYYLNGNLAAVSDLLFCEPFAAAPNEDGFIIKNNKYHN